MEPSKSVEDKRDDYSLREEFIAVMAHEMKNTLSSIVSFSEILLSQKLGKLNDRQKVRLQHILDGGSRLNSMIIDVLDFQKIGLGQLRIEKKKYELEEVCQEAILDISSLSDSKNITVNAHVDQVEIYCDYFRILQVLNNILNNGIKFSDTGSTITLNAFSDGNGILFEVVDEGVGIKESDLNKVFQKFKQSDVTRSLEKEGSGLGLAICKGIVELHGGKIWIESNVGKGTKVSFTVPGRKVFSTKP
ncbi:MAG: putative Histidine kinase [Nitrosopumilales archaeon]|nr:MAG: putative Histidine kinase [Nitrosopumilales archaeon]MCH8975810.1 HAMP domain-containing histidine kinase [Nitrososphaerota archaeon]